MEYGLLCSIKELVLQGYSVYEGVQPYTDPFFWLALLAVIGSSAGMIYAVYEIRKRKTKTSVP